MPIYEYKCPNGHLFEVIHSMSEPGPDACQECGEGPLERVLHPVAVHFKGSGFYATDYGRGSRRPETGKDGGHSSDSGSKAGESGSAASSEPKKAAEA